LRSYYALTTSARLSHVTPLSVAYTQLNSPRDTPFQ
jgi:hypothetical protein